MEKTRLLQAVILTNVERDAPEYCGNEHNQSEWNLYVLLPIFLFIIFSFFFK